MKKNDRKINRLFDVLLAVGVAFFIIMMIKYYKNKHSATPIPVVTSIEVTNTRVSAPTSAVVVSPATNSAQQSDLMPIKIGKFVLK